MKTIKLLSLCSLITIFTQSCYKHHGWPVKGKGDTVTEVRHAQGYDRINFSIDGELSYKQDSAYFLEVTAQPNVLAVIETHVNNNELKISYKREVWKHSTIRIVVHTPSLSGMTVSGSGNVNAIGTINARNLSLQLSGSGNVDCDKVLAANVTAHISGSGNITLRQGKCDTQDFSVSGSGNIDSEFCETAANISAISGSGNIRLNASESLSVRISGSGDVSYHGKPAMNVQISGSGKLIQLK